MVNGIAARGAISRPALTSIATDYEGVIADGSDISAALKKAHDAAYANGIREIWLPPGDYYAPAAHNISDVLWIGPGRIIGAYNRSVVSLTGGPYFAGLGNIIPSRHLRAAAAQQLGVVNVVFMGDSTSTRFGNSIHDLDVMQGQVRAKLMLENPGVKFNFTVASIGGASWDQFLNAQVPTAIAANPHLCIIHGGTNNAGGLRFIDLDDVCNALLLCPTAPDIILCTPYQRSRQCDIGEDEKPFQEARISAAGAIRTYAQWRGYGLLDFNRAWILARDGLDMVHQYTQRLDDAAGSYCNGTPAEPWYFPQSTTDFQIHLRLDNSKGHFFRPGQILSVFLSPNPTQKLNIYVSGGFVTTDYQIESYGAGRAAYAWKHLMSAVPVPTAHCLLVIAVKGGHMRVFLEPGRSTHIPHVIVEANFPRHGGLVTPRLVWSNTIGASNAVVERLCISKPLTYAPQMTDYEAWGRDAADEEYGGNNINHPTSIGLARVVAQTLEYASFSLDGVGMPIQMITGPATVNPDAGCIEISPSALERENCFLWSEDITDAVWTKARVSIAADTECKASHIRAAYRIIPDLTNGQHGILQACSKLAAAEMWTVSFILQAAEYTQAKILLQSASTHNSVAANFDLGTCTVSNITTSGGFSRGDASIEQINEKQFRCTVWGVSDESTIIQGSLFLMRGGVITISGNDADGLFVMSPHLRGPNSSPAYIPTGPTAVTNTSDPYEIKLAAPQPKHAGKMLGLRMARKNGNNVVTMALDNVIGGSAPNICTWSATDQTLVLLAAGEKWVVIKEAGVLLS